MKQYIMGLLVGLACFSGLLPVVRAEEAPESAQKNINADDLAAQFTKLRAASVALLERHRALQKKTADLEAKVATFEEGATEGSAKAMHVLQGEHTRLKAENLQLQEDAKNVLSMKKALADLTEQHEAMKGQNERLASQLKHSAQAQEELRTLLKKEQELGQSAKGEINALKLANKSLKEEQQATLNKMKKGALSAAELAMVKQKLISLQEDHADLNAELVTKEKDSDALDKLKQERVALLEELQVLKAERELKGGVAQALDALEGAHQTLKTQLAVVESTLGVRSGGAEELVGLKLEHEKLREQYQQLENQQEDSADSIALRVSNQALEQERAELAKAYAALEKKYERVTSSEAVLSDVQELVSLEDTNRRLQGELEKQKRQLVMQAKLLAAKEGQAVVAPAHAGQGEPEELAGLESEEKEQLTDEETDDTEMQIQALLLRLLDEGDDGAAISSDENLEEVTPLVQSP